MAWPRHAWQLPVAVLLVMVIVYALHFSGSYFSHTHQIMFGWGCVAVLALLHRYGLARRQPWRLLFLLISAFLALRYILWRAFDTLMFMGPIDSVGTILLFCAELYAIMIHFMGLFVNAWPLEREVIALAGDTATLPSVDVFIPTYNESDDIVRATVTAASQLDYPPDKLNIYIIDDGGTWQKRNHVSHGMHAWERHYRMKRMAAELGVQYLTREKNGHAKAGNINHALDCTDGELILILDCDHVPTRDFLQNTVGQFVADPKLFLVQTPHFFINPCPVEKHVTGIANPSAESDMFYRTIQPSMDAWGASYFCGSAALLRRTCLEQVGGVCGETITEDAETAFQLHSRGYRSAYINKPMVCGLSPESFDDYVIQRSRWAQGMLQLAILNNPLKVKGLSLSQRIVYFNASFFWFFCFARFIYFVAPAACLALNLNIYGASWLQVLAYSFPFVVSTFIVMDFIYGGTRQPFFSEIYESVQALFLLPAVISVLIHPRKPSFKVTPKGMTNDNNFLSPLSAPFFLVIAMNIGALVVATFRWFSEPALHGVIMVAGVWCLYNLFLALVSLGAFWERKQLRKYHRISAGGPIEVFFPRMNVTLTGQMQDVSLSGIGLLAALPFPVKKGERVSLMVSDSYGRAYRFEGRIPYAVPKGSGIHFCGTEFVTELVSYPEVVSFVFGDSRRWSDNWLDKSHAKGTWRMLSVFLFLGVRGIQNSLMLFLKMACVALWRTAVLWLTTPHARDFLLNLGAWFGYKFYKILMWLVQRIGRKPLRQFGRMSVSEAATVEFPTRNALLIGTLCDVSLTGIGVMLELPFTPTENEPVTVNVRDRAGREYHFACQLRRLIPRAGRSMCGVQFIVDMAAFTNIVQYVYGDSLSNIILRAGKRKAVV